MAGKKQNKRQNMVHNSASMNKINNRKENHGGQSQTGQKGKASSGANGAGDINMTSRLHCPSLSLEGKFGGVRGG